MDQLLDIDQALVQIRSMKHKWKELAETVRLPETLIEQVRESIMHVKGSARSLYAACKDLYIMHVQCEQEYMFSGIK